MTVQSEQLNKTSIFDSTARSTLTPVQKYSLCFVLKIPTNLNRGIVMSKEKHYNFTKGMNSEHLKAGIAVKGDLSPPVKEIQSPGD